MFYVALLGMRKNNNQLTRASYAVMLHIVFTQDQMEKFHPKLEFSPLAKLTQRNASPCVNNYCEPALIQSPILAHPKTL